MYNKNPRLWPPRLAARLITLIHLFFDWALRLIYFSKSKEHAVPSFSNQIAFPCLAYFSEIVAIYDINRQTAQVSILNQFVKTSQIHNYRTEDLSLATRFMLSSLEPIKCMPFSRESVPKFGTLFLIRLKYLNVRPLVKK